MSENVDGSKTIYSGICCAVGYNAPAASCALRASLDNFSESDFKDRTGEPILAAALMDEARLWGSARLARWARFAIDEALEPFDETQHAAIPIVLCVAGDDRPLGSADERLRTMKEAEQALERPIPKGSIILSGGRAVLGMALAHANKMLTDNTKLSRVLVVGVDSYLNGPTIEHYFNAERLLTPD